MNIAKNRSSCELQPLRTMLKLPSSPSMHTNTHRQTLTLARITSVFTASPFSCCMLPNVFIRSYANIVHDIFFVLLSFITRATYPCTCHCLETNEWHTYLLYTSYRLNVTTWCCDVNGKATNAPAWSTKRCLNLYQRSMVIVVSLITFRTPISRCALHISNSYINY